MGTIRSLARRALVRISTRVGKDGLFERPGEAGPPPPPVTPRAASAPAAPPAPAAAPAARPAPVGPAVVHPARALALPWDRPAGTRLVDIDGARALVGPGGGLRLVNHWATWCIPCVEELPLLRALAAELAPGVATLGLSWDLFDPRGDEEDIVVHVENFGAGHSIAWPSGVLGEDVDPEAFFRALDVRFDKVPQTWLVDGDGVVLHREEGALDPAAAERLRAAAARAQAAR
jgi:thiol-disulfide isomerase/thioredoxin